MLRTSNVFLGVAAFLAAACGGITSGPGDDGVRSSEAMLVTGTLRGLTVTLSSSAPLVQGVDNTFTWTVQNTSTTTISNVTIASNWLDDGGTNPVTKAMSPGCGTQSGTPIGVYCGTVTLAPGASVSNWVIVNPQKAGRVHYNAYGAYVDAFGSFNSCEVFDTETAAPGAVDLQISGSSNQGQPSLGSSYTYTYEVKNAGPWATSGGVSFSDPLPPSLTFVSATTTAGACTSGQTVSCALGDLAVGAHAIVAITVVAPSTAQSIVNTASASLTAPQSDTNPSNGSVSVTVTSK